MQGEDVENIGYVIPVDVVQHFITDFDRNGKFTSFPILGIEWQRMESPYMRKAMGMTVSASQFPNQRFHLNAKDPESLAKTWLQKT